MHLRRPSATLAVAVLVATPMLTSCGFSQGTDQPYTPGVGIIKQTTRVDVLSSVIVSARPGEGTFVATLSNREQGESLTFDSVTGDQGNTVVPDDIDPITIAPGDFVNLATDGRGVKLQGSFVPGDVVPLEIGFGSSLKISTQAVVVRACDEYAGLDPLATPTDSPTSAPTSPGAPEQNETPTVSPTDTPGVGEPDSSIASQESEETGDPAYSCEYSPSQE